MRTRAAWLSAALVAIACSACASSPFPAYRESCDHRQPTPTGLDWKVSCFAMGSEYVHARHPSDGEYGLPLDRAKAAKYLEKACFAEPFKPTKPPTACMYLIKYDLGDPVKLIEIGSPVCEKQTRSTEDGACAHVLKAAERIGDENLAGKVREHIAKINKAYSDREMARLSEPSSSSSSSDDDDNPPPRSGDSSHASNDSSDSNEDVRRTLEQTVKDSQAAMKQDQENWAAAHDAARRMVNAGRGGGGSAGNSGGGGATTPTTPATGGDSSGHKAQCQSSCRQFNSCARPYNACIRACNRQGNTQTPCEKTCETNRKSCQQSAGRICGTSWTSGSPCCECSGGAD